MDLIGDSGAVLVIRLPHELSHETADDIRSQVMTRLPEHDDAALILDATELRLVTSIGVAALLQIQEMCNDRGAPFVIAALSEQQQEFLTLLRLDSRFNTAPTVDEALTVAEGR